MKNKTVVATYRCILLSIVASGVIGFGLHDFAVADPPPDDLDQAQAQIDSGNLDQAESSLNATIQKDSRSSTEGAAASLLLATTYRTQGDVPKALTEADALRDAIKNLPSTVDLSAYPSASEVADLIDSLSGEQAKLATLQSNIDSATDPALRLDAQAWLLEAKNEIDQANGDWEAAYGLLVQEPDASDATRYKIEEAYLRIPPQTAALQSGQLACCEEILKDPNSSTRRKQLAISMLQPRLNYTSHLDDAQALLDAGKDEQAEKLLYSTVDNFTRYSAEGATASFMLLAHYRTEAQYQRALQEAQLLQSALAIEPADYNNYGLPSSGEVADLADAVSAQVALIDNKRKMVDIASDPAARLTAIGNLKLVNGDISGAHASWLAAKTALQGEPGASQELKYKVESNYLQVALPNDRIACVLSILHDPEASNARKILATSCVSAYVFNSSFGPAVGVSPAQISSFRSTLIADCKSSDSAIATLAKQSLISYVANRSILLTSSALQHANNASMAQKWEVASAAYRQALKDDAEVSQSNGGVSLPGQVDQQLAEAKRSLTLSNLALSSPKDSDCAYLGVDHTVGSDWKDGLGREGWVLFALHGSDLCGGPDILNDSLTYNVYLGDGNNHVRRWRDPIGYGHRTSDLTLDDPVDGASATAFVDDNGESYSNFAGPDLYIEVAVPAGRHILSLPVHFSIPTISVAHNGISVWTTPTGKITSASRCVAAGTVSVQDEPGYARFALAGPATYTVVIQREDSFNTNAQALFLDPDLRYQAPPSIADALDPKGMSRTNTGDGQSGSLTGLIGRFDVAVNEPQTTDWRALRKDADKLSDNKSLRAQQRTEAAYIFWRASERCPLATGLVSAAFRRYLTREFAEPPSDLSQLFPKPTAPAAPAAPGQTVTDLTGLAARLRSQGQIRLAEAADDAAWNAQVLSADANTPSAQDDLVNRLWTQVSKAYLQQQPIWLWNGTSGGPPRKMMVAVDAGYAALRAAQLVRAVAANDYTAGLLVNTDTDAIGGQTTPYDDPAAIRARILLNMIGQSAGMSINGVNMSGFGQPVGAIVYSAACEPLLGTLSSSVPSTNLDPAQTCLLAPDQIETLARAYVNEDIFADSDATAAKSRAEALLKYLKDQYPTYSRMRQANGLLASVSQGQ